MCADHIAPPQCDGGRGRQHIELSPSLLSTVSHKTPHVLGEAGNLLIDGAQAQVWGHGDKISNVIYQQINAVSAPASARPAVN